MKILNLFAGIGGNRTLWGDKHNITAIEHNQQIAIIYLKRFPNDKVIIGDAYQYLENHYREFDFVWASPPCPTHSKLCILNFKVLEHPAKFPDMRLYSLILFLKHWFKGKWIVENVRPYYKYLIRPSIILGRHPLWSNFHIQNKRFDPFHNIRTIYVRNKKKGKRAYNDFTLEELCHVHRIDINLLEGISNKSRILRNCVLSEQGKYILDSINNKTLNDFLIIGEK